MTQADIVQKQKRFSTIWIIPIVAILAGAWITVQHYLAQGPTVEVSFSTADGLKPGETRVKRLAVDLGVVEQVYLNKEFNNITAIIKLDKEAEEFLREDTQFWVVRPRVGAGGISGLSTLLSGAYIEILPGTGDVGKTQFRGLDDIPITPLGSPGLHLKLVADGVSSVSVGSPVLYHGYRVGRVEKAKLSEKDYLIHYEIFVEAPYHDLVNSHTRFWNASGLSVEAGANGISVNTESLEAIIAGGIAFGLPEGIAAGSSIDDSQQFELYPDVHAINEHPYKHTREYLLLFDSSVRGLSVGAPVEYRGIRIGTVTDVSMNLLPDELTWGGDGNVRIPVLIRIEPGRLGKDNQETLPKIDAFYNKSTQNGMRASLSSGSLLTGALYVSLDYYDEHKNTSITEKKLEVIEGYTVLPTVETGLVQLEQKVSNLLEKFQALPLENAVVATTTALDSVGKTLADLNTLIEDPDTKALPKELNTAVKDLQVMLAGLSPESNAYIRLEAALDELLVTLNDARSLINSLESKPNSLIFSETREADRVPTPKGQP